MRVQPRRFGSWDLPVEDNLRKNSATVTARVTEPGSKMGASRPGGECKRGRIDGINGRRKAETSMASEGMGKREAGEGNTSGAVEPSL